MATSAPRTQLGPRAVRDLRKLDRADARRVRAALADLVAGAENLDIKAVTGRPPWLRMRVGELRVLYRPLNVQETRKAGRGWLVARVIPRRELERAVSTLGI